MYISPVFLNRKICFDLFPADMKNVTRNTKKIFIFKTTFLIAEELKKINKDFQSKLSFILPLHCFKVTIWFLLIHSLELNWTNGFTVGSFFRDVFAEKLAEEKCTNFFFFCSPNQIYLCNNNKICIANKIVVNHHCRYLVGINPLLCCLSCNNTAGQTDLSL